MDNLLNKILIIAKQKGIAQKELARIAGIDPAALSRMKKLENVSIKSISKLLQAIHYKIELIPDNDYLNDLESGHLL